MGDRQRTFLDGFRTAFASKFGREVVWSGGQIATNTGALERDQTLRRAGPVRRGESFEIATAVATSKSSR